MKKSWLLSLYIVTFLSPIAFAAKDPIVAEANGIKIKRSELEKTYHQNLLFVSDKVVTREKVLNDLINRALGIREAKKEGLQNDPIVKSKMEEVLYHAKISKDLEPQFKKITVTNKDIKSHYKDYPEYRTAHILFRVRAAPTPEEIAGAQKTAIEVYRTVRKQPEKFAEFANKYSQSSTAPHGGDMGFQPAIRMAPEYFRAIKGKPKGYISPPVRTQFGYHIIKVLAAKDYKSINTPLYKKIVYDKKRDKILENYFASRRKKAKVNVNKKHLKEIPIDPSKLKIGN